MNEDGIAKVQGRIQDALQRIETAAALALRPQNSASSSALAALTKRHASLKSDTIAALSELDGIIAKAKS
jgi:hypothetical protein